MIIQSVWSKNLVNIYYRISIIFVILSGVFGFFSVSITVDPLHLEFLNERRLILDSILIKTLYLSLIFFFIFSLRKFNTKVSIFNLIIYLLSFLIIFHSLVLGNMKLSLLFGCFFYILIHYHLILNQHSFSKFNDIFSLSLKTFILLPIAVICFNLIFYSSVYSINSNFQVLFIDSLRGFFLDNVTFGYYAGLLFLSSFLLKQYFYSLLFASLACFAFSNAVFVAVFCTFLYFVFNQKNFLFLFVLGLIFFFILLYTLSISDYEYRLIILENFYNHFISDISLIFLGSGMIFSSIDSHQPHNSILQTLLDFGLLGLLLYFISSLFFLLKSNFYSRIIFIYIFIFGLFHAGFNLFSINPMPFFGYMLAIMFNSFQSKN